MKNPSQSTTNAGKALDPTDKQTQLVRATLSCFVSSLFRVFVMSSFFACSLKRSALPSAVNSLSSLVLDQRSPQRMKSGIVSPRTKSS